MVPKQSNYKIAAVFSSGLYEFDKNIVFFDLSDSLSFFEKSEDDINLEFFLDNPLNADIYKDEIQNIDQISMCIHGQILIKLFFQL